MSKLFSYQARVKDPLVEVVRRGLQVEPLQLAHHAPGRGLGLVMRAAAAQALAQARAVGLEHAAHAGQAQLLQAGHGLPLGHVVDDNDKVKIGVVVFKGCRSK